MSIEFNRECFLTTTISCDEDGCSASQEYNVQSGFEAIPLAIADGWTVGARSGVKFDSCPACMQHNAGAIPEEFHNRIDLTEASF